MKYDIRSFDKQNSKRDLGVKIGGNFAATGL